MIVKLLTEHHLEFLSLKGGCTGLSEYSLVKISNCWKSHVTAHFMRDLYGDVTVCAGIALRQCSQILNATCLRKSHIL